MLNTNRLFYTSQFSYLQNYYGTIKIPALITKLEYWFSKDKFRNGFFKFTEPCSHHLYKEGDSWIEEFGWRRDLFKSVFNKIGTRYKSKSDYKRALAMKDPFEGKLYLSYYDRQRNLTFYVRNHDYANNFFKTLVSSFSTASSKKIKNLKTLNISVAKSFINKKICSLPESCNAEKTQSPISTKINTNTISSIEKNSCATEVKKTKIEIKNKNDDLEKKMLAIWEKRIGLSKIWNKSHTFEKLKRAFTNFFESCLEKWEAFCLKIASSKFLMGEKSSFKISLDYAIKPEAITRIFDNGFTFGDRNTETENEKKEKLEKESFVISRLNAIMKNEHQKNKFLEEFLPTLTNQYIIQSIKTYGVINGFPKILFESFIRKRIEAEFKLTEITKY